MKFKTAAMAAAIAAVAAALAIAPMGASTTMQPFGGRQTLGHPDSVAAWTVTGLGPSSDVIPYRPVGRLYEAAVTVEADRGTVTPVIPPFNARTAGGQSYPVLAGVASPQGLNPSPLLQGQRSTGKLYFDVVGETPDSVAYTTGATDLLLWVGVPVPAAPTSTEPSPEPMMPGPVTPGWPFMPGMGWPPIPGPGWPMMPGY